MTLLDLLKRDAEYGFGELLKSLDGVSERQAWGRLPSNGSDYLHTDGSIQGIVLHLASVKWMYGSICFRNTEMRWRECAEQMEAFEPSWPAAVDYLERGHRYWMASWVDRDDVEEIRPTNRQDERPVWRIVQMMNQHDSYHAGQIALLRYGCVESDVPPESYAEDIRSSCRDFASW